MTSPTSTSWREELARRLDKRVAVVGVGNDMRGDDGVGPAIARALQERVNGACHGLTFDCGEVPENYLGPILGAKADTILLCDAVDFGGEPGTVRVLEFADNVPVPISTHNASMGLLAKVLTVESGAEVLLLGIQPAGTQFGAPLSEAVHRSVVEVVNALSELFERGTD